MKTIATYLALAAMVILTGCASVKDGAVPSATGNEQAAAETGFAKNALYRRVIES